MRCCRCDRIIIIHNIIIYPVQYVTRRLSFFRRVVVRSVDSIFRGRRSIIYLLVFFFSITRPFRRPSSTARGYCSSDHAAFTLAYRNDFWIFTELHAHDDNNIIIRTHYYCHPARTCTDPAPSFFFFFFFFSREYSNSPHTGRVIGFSRTARQVTSTRPHSRVLIDFSDSPIRFIRRARVQQSTRLRL